MGMLYLHNDISTHRRSEVDVFSGVCLFVCQFLCLFAWYLRNNST